jgi:hypothetical protein
LFCFFRSSSINFAIKLSTAPFPPPPQLQPVEVPVPPLVLPQWPKHLQMMSNAARMAVLSLMLTSVLLPTVNVLPLDTVLAELLAELARPFAVLTSALS